MWGMATSAMINDPKPWPEVEIVLLVALGLAIAFSFALVTNVPLRPTIQHARTGQYQGFAPATPQGLALKFSPQTTRF